MAMDPNQKTLLQKYTMVAKKIIYDPARMKTFMKMLGSKDGAVTAVHTVVGAIEKLKPIPAQLTPLLGVNVYLLMVDVAQEATKMQPDPAIMKGVIDQIMSEVGGQQAPAPQQGMLAGMQEQEEPGDAPGPDGSPEHENAESPAYEQQEGAEEDPEGEDPQAGMLARMQQRRGVPA
jgi:hypothetical protein